MRRREFISLISAAAAWPVMAQAQQQKPVIGFLGSQSLAQWTERLRTFKEGLQSTGYVEGENVLIEYRWAENQSDKLPALAADLVQRQVALIVVLGNTPSAVAAKSASPTIPVFSAWRLIR